MHTCTRRAELDWCIHWGQEVPKQVKAPFWCKSVGFLCRKECVWRLHTCMHYCKQSSFPSLRGGMLQNDSKIAHHVDEIVKGLARELKATPGLSKSRFALKNWTIIRLVMVIYPTNCYISHKKATSLPKTVQFLIWNHRWEIQRMPHHFLKAWGVLFGNGMVREHQTA